MVGDYGFKVILFLKSWSNSCFKMMPKLVFFFCHIVETVVGDYGFKLFKKVKIVVGDYSFRLNVKTMVGDCGFKNF